MRFFVLKHALLCGGGRRRIGIRSGLCLFLHHLIRSARHAGSAFFFHVFFQSVFSNPPEVALNSPPYPIPWVAVLRGCIPFVLLFSSRTPSLTNNTTTIVPICRTRRPTPFFLSTRVQAKRHGQSRVREHSCLYVECILRKATPNLDPILFFCSKLGQVESAPTSAGSKQRSVKCVPIRST